MNKRQLAESVARVLRENGKRKTVLLPKHSFYISDASGDKKEFVVRGGEKRVQYTADDVNTMLTALLIVVQECVRTGEDISLTGMGKLTVKYRKARRTRVPGTNKWTTIQPRFVPKFQFSADLKRCAKIFGETEEAQRRLDELIDKGELTSPLMPGDD